MNEVITLKVPDHGDIIRQGSAVVTKANAIEVCDAETYRDAGEFAVELRQHVKQIEQRFEPVCKAAFDAHRGMCRMRDDVKAAFVTAQSIVARKQREYREDEERRARAEEARIAELQRKEAEKQRAKEIRKLEKAGDSAMADAIKEAPVIVAPVVVAREIPKVAGQAIRKVWKFRVTNADLIPREFMVPDEKKLGAYARAMRESGSVPGVEFYAEEIGF